MNPITKAISEVKRRIPIQILEEGFLRQTELPVPTSRFPVSLDYRIREKILNEIVIPDCDLVGGIEINVPLSNVPPQFINNYKQVYRIPKELTNNRSITRVYSINYGRGGAPTVNNVYNNGAGQLMDAVSGALNALSPIPQVSNAYVQLIGENTVLVEANISATPMLYLRCVIENDDELTHLKPGSYKVFAKLVEYATKAYLFNNLIIPVDMSELSGGMQLGRFREILDGYADAQELYDTEFEERWRKIALFSDQTAYHRHLKRLVSGHQ